MLIDTKAIFLHLYIFQQISKVIGHQFPTIDMTVFSTRQHRHRICRQDEFTWFFSLSLQSHKA